MKKIAGKTLVAFGVMGLVALGAGSVSADTYTGTLTSAGGGITGTSAWVDNLTLAWTVDNTTNPGFWTYTYEFEDNDPGQQKELSHLIIEVSASFTKSDISADTPDVSIDSPTTFDPSDPSNPNLPGSIYGLKWNVAEEADGTDWTATLVTARAPVWGDFYVKDGKTNQVDNSAWNTGFSDADPLDLPANGSINNHVLVPDTYNSPAPEPGTLLLVGTGLASAGAWSRKRWFARKSA